MVVVEVVLRVVQVLLIVYLVLLWARIIFELAQALSREWRPRGFLLIVAEVVYTVTDPPIKGLRRVLPPLRLGAVAIDLSILIVMLVTIVLMSIVGAFLVGR